MNALIRLVKKLRGVATMANQKINGGASPYPITIGPADICSFSDGADSAPITSLSVAIEPKQNLNGYDYPWPGGGGKNKFDGSAVTTTHSSNWGIDWNATTNVITITQKTSYTSGVPTYTLNLASGTYVASYSAISETGKVSLYVNGSWVKSLNQGVTFSLNSEDTNEIRFAAVTVTKFQIESGSTPTTYAPYSNICPITGWTQVDGKHIGRNWYPVLISDDAFGNNGGATHTKADGVLTIETSAQSAYSGVYGLATSEITKTLEFLDGYTRVISFTAESTVNTPVRITSGATTNLTITPNKQRFSVPSSTSGFSLYAVNTSATIKVSELQIEIGSAHSPYKAYEEVPITVSLGQSVYGGCLDVVNGKLTITHTAYTFTGGETWNKQGGTAKYYSYSYLVSNAKRPVDNSQSVPIKTSIGFFDRSYNSLHNYHNEMCIAADGRIGITEDLYVGSGTLEGQTVYYELATPIEADLAPVTDLETYLGENNVWADAGQTTLTYYRAQSSVVAVWDRTRHIYTSIPLKYIRYDTYQINPAQAIDLDSYRSETGTLIRNVVGSKAKIEFNTPMMTDSQWSEVWDILSAGFNNANERKLKLKYYDTQSGSYKYGYFYVPDVNTPIRSIEETSGTINYNEIRLAFIEY